MRVSARGLVCFHTPTPSSSSCLMTRSVERHHRDVVVAHRDEHRHAVGVGKQPDRPSDGDRVPLDGPAEDVRARDRPALHDAYVRAKHRDVRGVVADLVERAARELVEVHSAVGVEDGRVRIVRPEGPELDLPGVGDGGEVNGRAELVPAAHGPGGEHSAHEIFREVDIPQRGQGVEQPSRSKQGVRRLRIPEGDEATSGVHLPPLPAHDSIRAIRADEAIEVE